MKLKFVLSLILLFSSFYQPQVACCEIKAVVFDCGGVLFSIDRSPLYEYLKQTLYLEPEEQRALFKSLKAYYGQGGDEKTFFLNVAKSKGVHLSQEWFDKLEQIKTQLFKEVPGMKDLVKKVQYQGYQTTMLSNISAYQAQTVRKLGYYDLFFPVILSYEVGVDKPNPHAYLILLEKLELSSHEILFIDDKPENVDSAKALGIDSILFQNLEQLVKELQVRHIL